MFFYFVTWFLASALAYRCGAFVHELVHQRTNKDFDYKFTWFWNLTAGLFMLMPSPDFNIHLKHHTNGVFGTKDDVQYPLVNSDRVLWLKLFFILPFVLPIVNSTQVLVRVLTGKNVYLFQKNDIISSRESDLIAIANSYYFVVGSGFALWSIFYPSLFLVWYSVSVGAWFLSALRVPLEHELTEYKVNANQVKDSVDRPKTIYTAIVQPLALNYHKTHHAHQSIPYHNLKDASQEL